MVARADVVVLALPTTDGRAALGAAELARMKPSATRQCRARQARRRGRAGRCVERGQLGGGRSRRLPREPLRRAPALDCRTADHAAQRVVYRRLLDARRRFLLENVALPLRRSAHQLVDKTRGYLRPADAARPAVLRDRPLSASRAHRARGRRRHRVDERPRHRRARPRLSLGLATLGMHPRRLHRDYLRESAGVAVRGPRGPHRPAL